MRLLALDLETTGLDTDNDEITEIGYVLRDTDIEKPLLTEGIMLRTGVKVPPEVTAITERTAHIPLGCFMPRGYTSEIKQITIAKHLEADK